MNALQEFLAEHPRLRKALYLVQSLLSLVMLVLAFALTTLQLSPLWFVIVSGSLSIVWSYLGLTASKNVDTGPED